MRDPWKYVAFPAAAIGGYIVSLSLTQQLQPYLGLSDFITRLVVLGAAGLVTGFLVDEVIPAYIEQHTGAGSGGDMDMGGGGNDDFDFE